MQSLTLTVVCWPLACSNNTLASRNLEQLAILARRKFFAYLTKWTSKYKFLRLLKRKCFPSTFKVAHLNFSEPHHPNFEWLILYCLSSVGQAASHVYQRLNELVKKVGLIDIGVTIATKRWRHDFFISAIFSTSTPKLLKWPTVS